MPPAASRHLVTPDAFQVDPALLGARLATPKRRLAALLLDLSLAAIIGKLAGVLIGLAVAVIFFRVATRRSPAHPLKRWARSSLALAGALVLFVTAIAVVDGDDDAEQQVAMVGMPDNVVGYGSDYDFSEAWIDSPYLPEEVKQAMREEVRQNAHASLAALDEGAPALDTVAASALLHRYADALAAADAAALDTLGAAAEIVAGPQLARLRARNAHLADRIDAQVEGIARLEDAAANPGLGRLLRNTFSDFGLTIGWVGIYFTLFLAWWGGQTPGKRLFGLRTVRLDGQPITLWNAFERFGGLGAGVATGLLGFAQIFWDANRQGIHDKIASTVVLREDARTAAASRVGVS